MCRSDGTGQCDLIQKYFCTGYDYGENADLSEGYRNPKRKTSDSL